MQHSTPAGIIVGTTILQVVSAGSVGLRFYTRFWRRSSILVSDWLILAAFVLATGLTITEYYGIAVKAFAYPISLTFHDANAANRQLVQLNNLQNVIFLTSIPALGLIRVSVSLLYWHLFAAVKLRRFLIFWIVLMVAWTLAFFICKVVECRGRLDALDPMERRKYCGACRNSGYVYAGSGILADLITLLIPLPIVISLSLPTKQKCLVLATFMIGALSVGASIAKGYMYIVSMMNNAKWDAALLLGDFSMWNLAEVQVGIIAACGMTLRPTLARILPIGRMKAIFRKTNEESEPKDPTLPSFVRPERIDSPREGQMSSLGPRNVR
ncbi:unnamed protein product [Periconia digitata]|uniref:Rhodopsin domain-containing protein n=1 Tax=Periconia digitata TaxID=1303443 RepID=A0A9W4XXZ8_9PLEO|nr:unnamed protein product [Periconia digitata]